MKTMNRPPVPSRNDSGLRAKKTFSAAVAALAAAMLALGSSDLMAAPISWQPNPTDQGVNVTISNDSTKWTVDTPLKEGDAVRTGSLATDVGVGLSTTENYYYVVGVGGTPSANVRFAAHPSGVGIGTSGNTTTIIAPRIPTWNTVGNWAGGLVPNGQDVEAAIATNSGTSVVMFDRDTTLGSLAVDTTAGSLSLLATARNGGMVSTLTLKTSIGVPTITVSGENSLTLSESKIFSTSPSSANAKLFLVGNQGLIIENNNTIHPPVAVTGTPPNYAIGAVRFGIGLNWTDFSGDLTLSKGVYQSVGGGAANTGVSSLPMNNKLVLGTGTNTARLEMVNSTGQSSVRGLESAASATSSIINASGGTSSLTFQMGSCGSATDSFNYAGNIGDTSSGLSSASAVRVVKVGAGTQILSGVNNINALQTNQAMLAINGGKLSLGSTGALGAVTAGQGTMNPNSYVQIRNGEFELSGGGDAASRSQTFEGSVVFGTMAPNSGSPDSNQLMQSSGANTLTVIAATGQPTTLTFGSIRPRGYGGANLNGSTTLYRGTSLGSNPGPGIASILSTSTPAIGVGGLLAATGSGATGTVQAAVLKGALADTSATGTGAGFATYEAVKGVRLLSSSEQNAAAYDGAPVTDNLLINLAAHQTIAGHLSNTLQINNSSGTSWTVTNSTTTLNAANGLLFSGTAPVVLTGGQITGTADSNAEDVVIQSINTSPAGVTIQTPISNIGFAGAFQGWISYSGPGNFRIEGLQSIGNGASGGSSTTSGIAFNGTGTTTLAGEIASTSNTVLFNFNQGLVKLDAGATWTKTPRLLIAAGAKFDLNGQGGTATARRFSDITGSFAVSTIAFNPSGGEVTNSAGGLPVDLYLAGSFDPLATSPFFGTITGNLNLVVDKSVGTTNVETGVTTYVYGSQTLAGANTYTGSTDILSGTLNLTRYGQLPSTTVVTLGTAGGIQNATLGLGDSVANANVPVRAVIGGLDVASGSTGTTAVINNSTVISELILNIPEGADNVYPGNLGLAITAPQGHNQNLFTIRKTGPGSFEPTGAVINYTGGTIIEGGSFRVSSDAKLGQVGPFTGTGHASGTTGALPAPMSPFPNSLILNGGTLQVTDDVSTDFVLNPLRGIGLGPVSGSTGGTGSLWVDTGVTLTYDGVIASAGNTGSQTLVKNGTGLLLLGGANTFTGVTQVAAGALGGTGSLASGVTVNSGGAIAPGVAGVGTFNVAGPLTFNAGSALSVDLGTPATPGSSDLIQLAGGAVSATGTTTVNITALSGFGVGSYTLIAGGGAVSASNFVVGSIPSGYQGSFSSAGGALTLTIAEGSALTGLETWRQTNFGTSANTGTAADTFDADGDGLANLLEYATGTNPNVSNVSPVTVARSGNVLALTYQRIADTTLIYTVEGTNDLTTAWAEVTEVGGNNPSTGSMNTAGPVTVTDTVTIANRRFLRLKVSY